MANQLTSWEMMYLVMLYLLWTMTPPLQLTKSESMPVGTRKGLTYQMHSMKLG